jgi:hypothetical protein
MVCPYRTQQLYGVVPDFCVIIQMSFLLAFLLYNHHLLSVCLSAFSPQTVCIGACG